MAVLHYVEICTWGLLHLVGETALHLSARTRSANLTRQSNTPDENVAAKFTSEKKIRQSVKAQQTLMPSLLLIFLLA